MYNFPELIKKIRKESALTQAQFASALEVSPVLIAMVETGQKQVSKNLLLKLAERLEVNPASITPFLYGSAPVEGEKLSLVERQFLTWGMKFQEQLIKKNSKKLKQYVK